MPDENESSGQRQRKLPIVAIVGFAFGIAAMAVCWVFCGSGIGLYFGGIVFAALLIPALVLSEEGLIARSIIAAGVCDGIAIVWLIGIAFSPVTPSQWLLCYAVLIAWCFALLGMTCLTECVLERLHLARRENTPGTPRCDHRELNEFAIPASAIVVVLAMLWLSSPIWSARFLLDHQGLTSYMIGPHPLFAINSVFKSQGIWSERPIAYRYLFTLGQDVPYELPRSIAPVAVVHLLIGGVALITARFIGRR